MLCFDKNLTVFAKIITFCTSDNTIYEINFIDIV